MNLLRKSFEMKKIILIILTVFFIISACSSANNTKDNGDSESEIVEFKSAYQLDPDSKRFRMLLGEYYTISGQYDKATENDIGDESWDDAYYYLIKRDASDLDATLGLVNAYILWGDSLSQNTSEQMEKYEDARKVLADYIEYDPDNPAVMYEIARIEMRYDNQKRFKELYRDAQLKDKNFKSIKDYTGAEIAAYLTKLNNYTSAKSLLKAMMNNGSREPAVHYEMAKIYREEEKYKDAEEELIKARDYCQEPSLIDPENPGPLMYANNNLKSDILNELGEIYLIESQDVKQNEKNKLLNLSRDHFKQAIIYDINNIKPYINLGNIYYEDLSEPGRTTKMNIAIRNFTNAAAKLANMDLSKQNADIVEIINNVAVSKNRIEAELFYKIGYLYYSKSLSYKDIIENEDYLNPEIKPFLIELVAESMKNEVIINKIIVDDENAVNEELRTKLLSIIGSTNPTEGELNNKLASDDIRDELALIVAEHMLDFELSEAVNDPVIKKILKHQIEKEYNKTVTISQNAFHISFSKGDYELRMNPNLNFSLANAYYLSENYKNCLNHYNNFITYYAPILKERYKNKEDTYPDKRRIHLELAKAYNNIGAAQFMLYVETDNPSYFDSAKRNFLEGQDYYYKYNRSINSPKGGNLRNLFDGKNTNLTRTDGIVVDKPLIYKTININLYDYK